MRIAITGSRGFIGQNLAFRLRESGYVDVVEINHNILENEMISALQGVNFIYHLAGVNRPVDEAGFATGNEGFTKVLCDALRKLDNPPQIVYTSSIQADKDNPYGRSKKAAEDVVFAYARDRRTCANIFRLPNVFGKWSRPHYNSAVATFCYQISRDLPIVINDPHVKLLLVYIDDVIDCFLSLLARPPIESGFREASPQYDTTVGQVANILQGFRKSRESLETERVGEGLMRALYSTYVSFLPETAFHYDAPLHTDPRGEFVEMLKTKDSGQISYFTAGPGVTRGEHYHHTKTEKFLVIRGRAHFGFRHIVNGAKHELIVEGGMGRIVETVPGWTHNVTNIGSSELIVMLWANERFDRSRPDTIGLKVMA